MKSFVLVRTFVHIIALGWKILGDGVKFYAVKPVLSFLSYCKLFMAENQPN